MTAHHKHKREKDKAYIKFIKSHSCEVCGDSSVDAHHVQTRGAGGSDYACIPLCRNCHIKLHSWGLDAVEARYRVNLWQAAWRYLKEWHSLP